MAEALAPGAPASKGRVFLRRLVSSVILWAVVLGAVFSGQALLSNAVILVILLGLSWFGLLEFYGLAERRGLVCFKEWGLVGGSLLIVSTFVYLATSMDRQLPSKVNDFESSMVILLVLGLCVRQFCNPTNQDGIQAIATTLFGLMYVPWLLNFIQKINFFPHLQGAGPFYVLYFVLVTKFSDTGAYVVGSLIGRHKMIPRISPGKTWEGFGGALLFSVGASWGFASWAGDRLPGMTSGHAILLGFLLGGAAVLGDLIESLFKREAGMKDSGRLFPGIGGILDLLDSLLFNAPLMYLYLRHVLVH